ncbi:hypothetical protein BCV72DRAFT_306513 [Rhizopus microsporus var. microsporus]|uniref:Uncharacterized protein n=1 Tax=Rhizopus microsporus var. microsporus TaxID=86635 RepID=A0A1X0R026_RHIZD|nr:hypothetical protein BCV72DRAFT_306513 [Rhizopus microsporus var. microsporus]
METNLAMPIKGILAFGGDEINSIEAQFRLPLVRTVEGQQQNVICAIESLIPIWKDVDLQPLSEGHLIASYAHPLIQSLLSVDNSPKLSYC